MAYFTDKEVTLGMTHKQTSIEGSTSHVAIKYVWLVMLEQIAMRHDDANDI